MQGISAVILAGALLLSLLAITTVAFWVRAKHRYLHSKLSSLSQRLSHVQESELWSVRDETRRLRRLLDIARPLLSHTNVVLAPMFTSQAGEDILVYDFFKDTRAGFFVEAGAYDGVGFSNTYILESLGWRGLLVEAHPDAVVACRRNRPNSIVEHAALGPDGCHGMVDFTCAEDRNGAGYLSFLGESRLHLEQCKKHECTMRSVRVPMNSLNSLLTGRTERVNFLSLDVEGMELEVLKGFELDRFSPSLVLIEYQWDDRDIALHRYLEAKGYVRVARKGTNVFYVVHSERAKFLSLCCEGESLPA